MDCTECDGSGVIEEPCPECHGNPDELGDMGCPRCGGDGWVEEDCLECDGTGEVEDEGD